MNEATRIMRTNALALLCFMGLSATVEGASKSPVTALCDDFTDNCGHPQVARNIGVVLGEGKESIPSEVQIADEIVLRDLRRSCNGATPTIKPVIPTNAPLTPAMEALLNDLTKICDNPVVEAAFNEAIAHVVPVLDQRGGMVNWWVGVTVDDFVEYFRNWFTFLANPTTGLGKIQPFSWFYYDNPSALYFLNDFQSKSGTATEYTKEIFNWTVAFIEERGKFMDSIESTLNMADWMGVINQEDYIIPVDGFTSFNEFFTRELNMANNPRPIAEPNNDAIVTASADSVINFIMSDLTLKTRLDVKTRQLNVLELLNQSPYAEYFVGGTAVSCVLMPNDYHHYHSPVTGVVVESGEVPGLYNGSPDGKHWVNFGNLGEGATDFSYFEDYHRAYYIIKTENHGYVGVVPVGLNTISSIFSIDTFIVPQGTVPPGSAGGVDIAKGAELGNFAYGGSLVILLFSPGVFSSVSVLMGQRLGVMNTVPTA